MDMIVEGDTFHCKLSTPARLINPAKKVPIYLVLDASHVQELEVCNNETKAIPSSITSGFIERALCTSSDDIVGLRFVLKRHAPLVTPDSILQKRPSSCDEIEALLRIGQYETFKVYVPSSAINSERLPSLCNALAEGALNPAPEGVVRSLYPRTTSKLVTRIDQLWSLYPQGLPSYDQSTGPGASKDESTGQSDFRPPSRYRARIKRRISSPASRQTASKRQLLTEKPVPEPWELAIAAQGDDLAALRAELWALREEQQLRCTAVFDPENKPRCPPDQVAYCASPTDYVLHSQTSTAGDTVEDRPMMAAEDAIYKEQKQRALSDANADYNNNQVRLEGSSRIEIDQSHVDSLL
ncbi:hypothetical protein D6D01_10157 [Aureobasidium pullulans]|uniref:Uncharacterized protein n=1 Tax=Aureobasidium pullulans TaxID=5580 RepID=A0A4S9JPV8_AURPU|nr:hypothetical protein D6D01_10157 [Aureobasidium pullulans]